MGSRLHKGELQVPCFSSDFAFIEASEDTGGSFMKVDLPYWNICTSPSNNSVDLSLLNSEKRSELAYWSGKLELTLRQSCTALFPGKWKPACRKVLTLQWLPLTPFSCFCHISSEVRRGECRALQRSSETGDRLLQHLGQHFPRYSGSLTIRVFSATSRHQLLKSNSGLMARYSDRRIPEVNISEILAESPWLSNYSYRSLRSRIYCAKPAIKQASEPPMSDDTGLRTLKQFSLTLNWVMSNFMHVDDLTVARSWETQAVWLNYPTSPLCA